MKSTLARKHPMAAIEAFRRAFPAEVNATHLIRCLDHAAFPEGLARMQAAASGDERIRVVAIGREESSIEDAYLACDVYLSLHRSEGFGLNLAEALSMGLPVIGTRWSLGDAIADHRLFIPVPSTLVGVVDDQHLYDRVAGARWAEPDVGFAADALSRVAASAHAPDTGPSKS
jgi:glycosyltransferase involved in cell wall biosynthesis